MLATKSKKWEAKLTIRMKKSLGEASNKEKQSKAEQR